VRREAAEFIGILEQNVHPESRFFEDLGCDSLDIMELIMKFEDRFGVTLEDDSELDKIRTVQDAATLLRSTLVVEEGLPADSKHVEVQRYDETEWLNRYIFVYCRDLLTDAELNVHGYILASEKEKMNEELHREIKGITQADSGIDEIDDDDEERLTPTPEIEAALSHGEAVFFGGVRDRLLGGAKPKLTVKRCHGCSRVLATPLAKQCNWCGRQWHK